MSPCPWQIVQTKSRDSTSAQAPRTAFGKSAACRYSCTFQDFKRLIPDIAGLLYSGSSLFGSYCRPRYTGEASSALKWSSTWTL